ncbi:hypothetical protein [Nannocystis sp.]|uniref:hypothetical protein n=1 Tax=Nannocystis sp. TaxID=1962667 RepID=UPI0025FAC744|nr:hypothetical protein [Nannocystis sp.]MBK7829430.1 hypothetical protein [Nannocystis sp.]
MAARAIDPADFNTVAQAFARRGAGSCAVSPPKNSVDLVGVKEDFQVRANGVILAAKVDDSLASCDDDGIIDGGELGRVELTLYNAGAELLPAGAIVEVHQPDPALVFPDGPSLVAPALEALSSTVLELPISIAAIQEYRPLTLTLRLVTPGGCVEFLDVPLDTFIHADLKPMASRDDDLEVTPSVWTTDGGNAEAVWRRSSGPEGGFFWHADDVGRPTDTPSSPPPSRSPPTSP